MESSRNWPKFVDALPLDKINYMNFLAHGNPKELFNFFWKLKEFHAQRWQIISNEKDDVKALELRNEGNSFYKEMRPKEALKRYNESIIYSRSDSSSGNLSNGYANRSSVLFSIGQYKKCLKDIDRALDNGYPMEKSGQLINRREKCMKALKTEEEENLSSSFHNLQMSSEREVQLPQCCKEEMSIRSGEASFPDWKSKYQHLFTHEQIRTPDLESSNPRAPSLSSAADIGYSEEKGRIIYATRDIYPGEIILKEKVYAYAPDESSKHSNCRLCGVQTWTPVPCPSCSVVVFCGDECLNSAIETFHGIECPIVPTLLDAHSSISFLCIVRMLLERRFDSVKELFTLYENEAKTKPSSELGFNESGIYSSADLRTIYHLCTNFDKLEKDLISHHCFLSLMMMQLIATETTYLGEKKRLSPSRKLSDEFLKLALILLRLIMVVSNGFIQLTQTYFSSIPSLTPKKSGVYFSSVNSLFSHSCHPNVILEEYVSTKVRRALIFISKGSEITIKYSYPIADSASRRKYLLKNFNFLCHCEACEQDCPSSSNSKTICPNCKADIGMQVCVGCGSSQFAIPPAVKLGKESMISTLRLHDILASCRLECYISDKIIESNEKLKKIAYAGEWLRHFNKQPSEVSDKLMIILRINFILRSYHLHSRDVD